MDPTDQSSPPPDSPLDQVIDDESPDVEQAVDWAAKELLREKTFDAVIADLLAGGWSPGLAENIVEQARELTRSRRGVHTREDVLKDAERRYRRSLRRVRLMLVAALAVLVIILLFFFQQKK